MLGGPAFRRVLPVLLALPLSNVACTTFEIAVPAGTSGRFPEYVGGACEAAAREGVVVRTAARGLEWQASGPGSVRVTCAKGSVRLSAIPIARLSIEVESRLRMRNHTEHTVRARAFGADGRELDLWQVRGEEIVWSAPPSVRLSQPRCGHMAALCVGFVGNGYLMNAVLVSDAPATLSVTVAGVVGTAMIGPLPAEP